MDKNPIQIIELFNFDKIIIKNKLNYTLFLCFYEKKTLILFYKQNLQICLLAVRSHTSVAICDNYDILIQFFGFQQTFH